MSVGWAILKRLVGIDRADLLAPPLRAEVLITVDHEWGTRIYTDKLDSRQDMERLISVTLRQVLVLAESQGVQVVIDSPGGPIVLNELVRRATA